MHVTFNDSSVFFGSSSMKCFCLRIAGMQIYREVHIIHLIKDISLRKWECISSSPKATYTFSPLDKEHAISADEQTRHPIPSLTIPSRQGLPDGRDYVISVPHKRPPSFGVVVGWYGVASPFFPSYRFFRPRTHTRTISTNTSTINL